MGSSIRRIGCGRSILSTYSIFSVFLFFSVVTFLPVVNAWAANAHVFIFEDAAQREPIECLLNGLALKEIAGNELKPLRAATFVDNIGLRDIAKTNDCNAICLFDSDTIALRTLTPSDTAQGTDGVVAISDKVLEEFMPKFEQCLVEQRLVLAGIFLEVLLDKAITVPEDRNFSDMA